MVRGQRVTDKSGIVIVKLAARGAISWLGAARQGNVLAPPRPAPARSAVGRAMPGHAALHYRPHRTCVAVLRCAAPEARSLTWHTWLE